MNGAVKIAFHTLGCKLNQAETEQLMWQAVARGYHISAVEDADICVLNTCTVTHIADRKARHLVRLWRKRNPHARIITTGCYAQRAARELVDAGADMVIGNEQKMRLLDIVGLANHAGCGGRPQWVGTQPSRVRSFIKIQDGCNTGCSYCIVPRVRGSERSLPVETVISETKDRTSRGYQEIVLTGTKIGSYRNDGTDLAKLVRLILRETAVARLHLSSLQPQDISPELLELWQDPRLCHHFHLALQSGSDSVLKRMGRCYRVEDYARAVELVRRAVPDAAITTDIMVGFPGESEAEFEESYLFCSEMDFAAIHVFPYSPRPGTLAAEMPAQVPETVKKARSQKMLALSAKSSKRFRRRFLGREMMVLWEAEVSMGSGIYSGLTHNYIRVFAQSATPLSGTMLPARLLRLHEDGIWAEPVSTQSRYYPAIPSPLSRC
jgi:threonylcarbamoyladenosine tRNA methylthiotransferase MtaB